MEQRTCRSRWPRWVQRVLADLLRYHLRQDEQESVLPQIVCRMDLTMDMLQSSLVQVYDRLIDCIMYVLPLCYWLRGKKDLPFVEQFHSGERIATSTNS